MVVYINLYNFVSVNLCVPAVERTSHRDRGLASYRDASPIITFHLINYEIRARVVVGDSSVAEYWRWIKCYQTGKIVHVHTNLTYTEIIYLL